MIPLDSGQRYSAALGMILILLIQLHQEEIVRTVLLAGIGGAASYIFTLLVKYVIGYFKKK